jgi:serine/threonine protein phosphatase 1
VSAPRTFVVGDVHGCVDELNRLLDALRPETGDTLCFLGDYVDRGPSPRGVIERLLRLRHEGPRCVFLKGNHEDMFLDYLGQPGHYGDAFVWNGGDATLASYGLYGVPEELVGKRFPRAHRDFLLALQSQAVIGRFLCVHAGIRPTMPLEEQVEEDLFWIREEFIDAEHPFPYTVLYGHTPQRDVRLHLPFKLGLDTGCVYGNRLSCLELTSKDLWQVARGAHVAARRSLEREFTAAGLKPA